DGAFGQDFLLVADVEPAEKETPPKLAIEAVWAGDDPYLVAGGRRFFVGAAIGDGWTIGRIGAGEITFKRGDRSFSLTL
ncbi:MAG: SctD/MshK family protein, partial [Geminicoccaceae bacterium]